MEISQNFVAFSEYMNFKPYFDKGASVEETLMYKFSLFSKFESSFSVTRCLNFKNFHSQFFESLGVS